MRAPRRTSISWALPSRATVTTGVPERSAIAAAGTARMRGNCGSQRRARQVMPGRSRMGSLGTSTNTTMSPVTASASPLIRATVPCRHGSEVPVGNTSTRAAAPTWAARVPGMRTSRNSFDRSATVNSGSGALHEHPLSRREPRDRTVDRAGHAAELEIQCGPFQFRPGSVSLSFGFGDLFGGSPRLNEVQLGFGGGDARLRCPQGGLGLVILEFGNFLLLPEGRQRIEFRTQRLGLLRGAMHFLLRHFNFLRQIAALQTRQDGFVLGNRRGGFGQLHFRQTRVQQHHFVIGRDHRPFNDGNGLDPTTCPGRNHRRLFRDGQHRSHEVHRRLQRGELGFHRVDGHRFGQRRAFLVVGHPISAARQPANQPCRQRHARVLRITLNAFGSGVQGLL